MILHKYFVWYTYKKAWYKKRKKESIVVSFENNVLFNCAPFECLTTFKYAVKKETDYNSIKIKSINYLGEFMPTGVLIGKPIATKYYAPISKVEAVKGKFDISNFL